MIRLTILYNLPPGSDEAEFLQWRLGEHQAQNAGMDGVIHTDFARVDAEWTLDNPRAKPTYRFMTIAEWDDRASFEASFYGTESQDGLRDDLKRIADQMLLISEILVST